MLNDNLKAFLDYFQEGFKNKEDFRLDSDTYSYNEIKEATKKLKVTDPYLYRTLEYLWICSDYSRNRIASTRGIDASTLHRTWRKSLDIIKNYITHPELTPDLEAVNFYNYD